MEFSMNHLQNNLTEQMKIATHLLRTTRLGIQAIARRCGFDDQSAFSSTFKEHVWLTPTDYRRGMIPEIAIMDTTEHTTTFEVSDVYPAGRPMKIPTWASVLGIDVEIREASATLKFKETNSVGISREFSALLHRNPGRIPTKVKGQLKYCTGYGHNIVLTPIPKHEYIKLEIAGVNPHHSLRFTARVFVTYRLPKITYNRF
jgi:hypothetical protein